MSVEAAFEALTFGAPVTARARYVVSAPPLHVLYEVDERGKHTPPRFQPWLDDLERIVPQHAVSVIDVRTDYDDSALDDGGANTLERIMSSLPVLPTENATDVYGNSILERTEWAYGGGDQERILERARAVAAQQGVTMSDEALMAAVQSRRSLSPRNEAAALAINQTFHIALLGAGVPHQDFTLERELFGEQQGARSIVVRIYTFHNLAVVDEVRSATSDGQQRAIWACTPVAGASRFEERLAIIYAAPLPFRHCFLQRTSPPLADYAANLQNFPWLPIGLTCREATRFFDWEAHTPRFSPLAVCAEWQVMTMTRRSNIVQRRANVAETRVRHRLLQAAAAADATRPRAGSARRDLLRRTHVRRGAPAAPVAAPADGDEHNVTSPEA